MNQCAPDVARLLRRKPFVVFLLGLHLTALRSYAPCGDPTLSPMPSSALTGVPWAPGITPPELAGYDTSWISLRSSADGTKLVGVIVSSWPQTQGWSDPCGNCELPPPLMVLSTNSGKSWAATGAPDNNWVSVATSADGARLVAAATLSLQSDAAGAPVLKGDGLIYYSSDSGMSWRMSSGLPNLWACLASSADGSTVVAAASPPLAPSAGAYLSGDGLIYISRDGGVTWAPSKAPSLNWASLAASADGRQLVAASLGYSDGTSQIAGAIYRSADSGTTWIKTSAPGIPWTSVALSVDGTKLVALGGTGQLHASNDAGATWTSMSTPALGWAAFAMSADGTRLIIASAPGYPCSRTGLGQIYTSTDSGTTWTLTGAPTASWTCLACSADGYRVAAASNQGDLCTLPYLEPWRWVGATNFGLSRVAASADGTHLVAVQGSGQIYTSSDAGLDWLPASAPAKAWVSVASSADGSKLLAATWDDQLYRSLDSGANWTASAPTNYWSSVACSADGSRWVAASVAQTWTNQSGRIYVSADSGATWTTTSAPADLWSSAAVSADGTKLVAAARTFSSQIVGSGRIYLSTDSGSSWKLSGATSNNWISVACSASGTKLVAVASLENGGDGLIYTSSDSGATWNSVTTTPMGWSSVACSADGNTLVAVGFGVTSVTYVSTNSGAAWSAWEQPAGAGWTSAACSADGGSIFAVGGPLGVLRWPLPPPPVAPRPDLSIRRYGQSLELSWPIPSTTFRLQQNANLASGQWVDDVPEKSALQFSNLQQWVVLPLAPGNVFFRLKEE
jgi:photosystem II stability/assembly factor-like uncharacterized protein